MRAHCCNTRVQQNIDCSPSAAAYQTIHFISDQLQTTDTHMISRVQEQWQCFIRNSDLMALSLPKQTGTFLATSLFLQSVKYEADSFSLFYQDAH